MILELLFEKFFIFGWILRSWAQNWKDVFWAKNGAEYWSGRSFMAIGSSRGYLSPKRVLRPWSLTNVWGIKASDFCHFPQIQIHVTHWSCMSLSIPLKHKRNFLLFLPYHTFSPTIFAFDVEWRNNRNILLRHNSSPCRYGRHSIDNVLNLDWPLGHRLRLNLSSASALISSALLLGVATMVRYTDWEWRLDWKCDHWDGFCLLS